MAETAMPIWRRFGIHAPVLKEAPRAGRRRLEFGKRRLRAVWAAWFTRTIIGFSHSSCLKILWTQRRNYSTLLRLEKYRRHSRQL
jgi:hypothetical protein